MNMIYNTPKNLEDSKTINEKRLLLVTGCVSPDKHQKNLVLVDPNERLEQYLSSLRFYIKNTDLKKIVFCENSGYQYDSNMGLYELAKTFSKEFEWISFVGNSSKVVEFGKGYGEGEIIKYVLNNSKILNESNITQLIKITGRLIVKNIDIIVSQASEHASYFNYDIYSICGVDTRLYICNLNFYRKYLEDKYYEVNDNAKNTIERIFFKTLNNKMILLKPLHSYPLFVGVCGGTGRIYENTSMESISKYDSLCQKRTFNIYMLLKYWKKLYKKRRYK